FFDADGKSFVRVSGKTIEVEQINLISDPAILNSEVVETLSTPENSPKNSKEDLSFSENIRNSKEIHSDEKLLNRREGDKNFPGAKNSKNGY
ncbi:MAG: hypothetical protein EBS19_14495, partial [Spirochaetia bacterium]|nr:hypothetical protein [Spirochaetia bacterium]